MSIKSIEVLNVMAFQRLKDAFSLQFCEGINILIGENGMGKSTLLKMIYAATQWSIPHIGAGKTKRLVDFFSGSLSDKDLLKNHGLQQEDSYFEVSDGEHTFTNNLSRKEMIHYDQWLGLNIQSVFIPTTEMLSHSKGFLALDKKYKLPFDGTQVDIIINASLPEAREIPALMERVLEKISSAINGTVMMEDDTFYVIKADGKKVDFSLEAEGLRKLGLLWKLIRNGLLEKGTILLWDEPEANLNPELFPLVVDILLELEEVGIQIFIATHSYNLAKYFEIRRKREGQVLYHNLYCASIDRMSEHKLLKTNVNNMEIYGQSANYLSLLTGNKIVAADDDLLEEAVEKNMLE